MVAVSLFSLLHSAIFAVTQQEENIYSVLQAQWRLKKLDTLLDTNSQAVEEAKILLAEKFHLHLREHPKLGYSFAVFTDIIPHLKEYAQRTYLSSALFEDDNLITTADLDHSVYLENLVSKKFPPTDHPAFAALDQRVSRDRTTWTFPAPDQKKIIIRPILSLEELDSFMNPDSSFCFFDPDRNAVQLYLYAAHRYTRLLGVWEEAGDTTKPLGVCPFYLMYLRSSDVLVSDAPWLYLEAPMIECHDLEQTVTVTSGEEVSLTEALYLTIASYAALQSGPRFPLPPFPIIGTNRKDQGAYSAAVRTFLDLTSKHFTSPAYSNQVVDEPIPTSRGVRAAMDLLHHGEAEFEVPEDKELLEYLQAKGYRFPTVLMSSQAFIKDGNRQKQNLYGDWGQMRGKANVVPFMEFYAVMEERLRLNRGGTP